MTANGHHAIRNMRRVAVATIAGYRFQILHTIRAWLKLDDDRFIVAEGNEDIDHVFADGMQIEEQIKLLTEAIGQRDTTVIETVLNYLKAFVYHDQRGRPFTGILRTTARIATHPTTAIGKWIAGKRFNRRDFSNELKAHARHAENDYTQELAYIRKNEKLVAFLASVEWAGADAGPGTIEAEIEELLAARDPTVPIALSSRTLQAHILEVLSKHPVEHRTLRRIDADIELSNVALMHAIDRARVEHSVGWTAAVWSAQGPPSIAVVVLVRDPVLLMSAVDTIARRDRAARKPRDVDTILRDEIRAIDFIAYASRRMHSGSRGERVCLHDVVKQVTYRLTPSDILVSASSPPWVEEIVTKRWPAPTRVVPEYPNATMLRLAKIIAEAVIDDERHADLLRAIESKLRWVHDIGEKQFYTAKNPLR